MKRWHKILLGLGCHWLFIYLPVLLVAVFAAIATQAGKQQPPPPALIGAFVGLGCIHFLSIFFMLGTLGVFIAYAVKHPRFTGNERLMWVLLLAFAGGIAAPIFFWLCFVKHPIGEPFFGDQA